MHQITKFVCLPGQNFDVLQLDVSKSTQCHGTSNLRPKRTHKVLLNNSCYTDENTDF